MALTAAPVVEEPDPAFILNDPAWDGIAMLLETPKDDTLAEDAANLARLCALVEDTARIPPGLRARKQADEDVCAPRSTAAEPAT